MSIKYVSRVSTVATLATSSGASGARHSEGMPMFTIRRNSVLLAAVFVALMTVTTIDSRAKRLRRLRLALALMTSAA